MPTFMFLIKSFSGVIFFFIILFIAAGKIRYQAGWIYFAVCIVGLLVHAAAAAGNPDLARERSKPGPGAKSWDKKILGISALLTMAAYALAGLDSGRFGWSPSFGIPVTAAGIALVAAGQTLFTAAKYRNPFFSSVVRIQTERNHSVCTGGLYRFVRHPGYLGMTMTWIGFPMILNSAFSSIPVLALILLLIIRTVLEDRFLAAGLPGYKEYMRTTKYRLVPFIW